jgi:hypothetical protein
MKLYKHLFTGHAVSKRPRGMDLQEQVRLAREKQQELLNERAKEAARVRAEKEAAEQDRKNHCVIEKKKTDNDDETKQKKPKAAGYNPMQPYTTSSSGGRYRYDPNILDTTTTRTTGTHNAYEYSYIYS